MKLEDVLFRTVLLILSAMFFLMTILCLGAGYGFITEKSDLLMGAIVLCFSPIPFIAAIVLLRGAIKGVLFE